MDSHTLEPPPLQRERPLLSMPRRAYLIAAVTHITGRMTLNVGRAPEMSAAVLPDLRR